MIHRALLGTFERFLGILIEETAGELPVWLAPVQAAVLPVADRHNEYARGRRGRAARRGCAPSSTTARSPSGARSATPSCRRSRSCSSSATARPSRAPSPCAATARATSASKSIEEVAEAVRAAEGFEPITDEGAFVQHIGPLLGRDGVVGLADRRAPHQLVRQGAGRRAGHAGRLRQRPQRRAASPTRRTRRWPPFSLTVDYLGGADEGDWVEAHVTVERLGGTLAFVDCSLTDGEREIVRGRAVFAVLT